MTVKGVFGKKGFFFQQCVFAISTLQKEKQCWNLISSDTEPVLALTTFNHVCIACDHEIKACLITSWKLNRRVCEYQNLCNLFLFQRTVLLYSNRDLVINVSNSNLWDNTIYQQEIGCRSIRLRYYFDVPSQWCPSQNFYHKLLLKISNSKINLL